MKNRFFLICIAVLLSLPTCMAVDNNTSESQMFQTETTTTSNPQPANDTNQINNELTEDMTTTTETTEASNLPDNLIQTPVQTPYKNPISKRKLVKKFLLAMFGVIISSLILYVGLTLYNKIRYGIENKVRTLDGEVPLQAPDDMTSAIQTFLSKTKWK